MNKDELDITNWKRILIGEVPPEFMLETFFRTIIIYLFLIFILRMLGKRMNAQLTLTEMAVMLTLGAVVAPAMQIPNRGLLPAILILVCILALQRGLGQLSFKHRKVEVVTQGDVSLMVKDGILVLAEMSKSRVSRAQLFGALRTHKIRHLGEVKRVYLESGGFFSVFRMPEPKPGLSIVPERDYQLPQPVDKELVHLVCKKCGKLVPYNENHANQTCDNCEHQEWTYPIS
ncbi:DUF421 domain-containing protein [Pontibacter harenae]|uniref:DUF421 domain-containing protein n=1 Tax=Pontibacter harenae TaxID=2894083 RepID=UPI001E579B66|nr:YetF domain-containing protein [Pontibacter harenae]MCC9167259.1 DUF421 domain-containing protein [Pontibacter harenae]